MLGLGCLWLWGVNAQSLKPVTLLSTLGARGFSCAVSGFGQVLKSDPRFAARVFGLRPNTCRSAADETKLPVAHEKKPLVPRVIFEPTTPNICNNIQQGAQPDATCNIQQ